MGWQAATGDIVVDLDADAYPDDDWLHLLALSFEDGVAASGGPNLPVPGSGLVERAVAASPGSPREVLLEANQAEHVPGCALAVRRDVLDELGGFNPVYTAAGDDVDLCWRILDRGGRIAFAPGAQIFHHRRATIRGYLRQQRGYSRAERQLASEHRHRFNLLGQARWLGFVYGESRLLPRWLRPVVYTGWAGTAPFQPIAERRTERAATWIGAMLPLFAALSLPATPLAVMWPAASVLPALVLLGAIGYGVGIALALPVSRREGESARLRGLVGFLHVAQPLVRAWGRVTCRPPTPSPPASNWTGNRVAWLVADRRGERRATVTGSPRECLHLPGPGDRGFDSELPRERNRGRDRPPAKIVRLQAHQRKGLVRGHRPSAARRLRLDVCGDARAGVCRFRPCSSRFWRRWACCWRPSSPV